MVEDCKHWTLFWTIYFGRGGGSGGGILGEMGRSGREGGGKERVDEGGRGKEEGFRSVVVCVRFGYDS